MTSPVLSVSEILNFKYNNFFFFKYIKYHNYLSLGDCRVTA